MIIFTNGYSEHHERAINDSGYSITEYNDGDWKTSNDVEVQKILDTFDPLPAAKISSKRRIIEQIRKHSDAQKSYSSIERSTFSRQLREATAHESDVNSLTPLLDKIAVRSGINKSDLVLSIIKKSNDEYDLASSIVGERNRLESIIDIETDYKIIDKLEFIV